MREKGNVRWLACALAAAILLTGCGSTGVLKELFTRVTAADAQWQGVKVGDPVALTPLLLGGAAGVSGQDERLVGLAGLLLATSGEDPVGVLMPVSLIGETTVRWVLCDKQFVAKCKGIPLHAKVSVAGTYMGGVWRLSRLTAENFND